MRNIAYFKHFVDFLAFILIKKIKDNIFFYFLFIKIFLIISFV